MGGLSPADERTVHGAVHILIAAFRQNACIGVVVTASVNWSTQLHMCK